MGISRRGVLKAMGSATVASVLPVSLFGKTGPMELSVRLAAISRVTVRITVLPAVGAHVPDEGYLVTGLEESSLPSSDSVDIGDLRLELSASPPSVGVFNRAGELVQRLGFEVGGITFSGSGHLLGGGEGGAQFDRRGSVDRMISGSGGYDLERHGSRVPIPWLIGTEGWAIFFHQPRGTFDLTGPDSRFKANDPAAAMDVFVVASKDPKVILAEYARLTGLAPLPPLWSLGYLQSHRTLGDRASVLAEAKTFREKRLPCEAMIYLGTGFCPNGWNVRNGSFEWNSRVFPDPAAIISELHADHFKVINHVVIESKTLRGSARDKFDVAQPNPAEAASNWNLHRPDFSMGIDGWWPDEGDWFDMPARLDRNRMYWEGPQIDRPNERPFALHRNGAPGMQRYGAFLWSGDVYSRWETLRNQVPIGINTGLSGIPYWGTDIGGFVPTPEFTAELYLRWFQFGAFCPLFRCHGRNWTLRLPWGWDTGDPGPIEVRDYRGSGLPEARDLHNKAVEPICRKYLELRSRLMPYLYSVVREGTRTGLPVMRALWLHYPSDAQASARGDSYLWGRDILVAPVVEKGAASRTLYLPKGRWFDYWTGEAVEGGREFSRDVDLATIPLYVRAGALIPMGPVRQYVGEPVPGAMEIHVYPGANGSFLLYEDDGKSFDFRHGEWMGIELRWNDARRALSLSLAKGSKMLGGLEREIKVHVGERVEKVLFKGERVSVRWA